MIEAGKYIYIGEDKPSFLKKYHIYYCEQRTNIQVTIWQEISNNISKINYDYITSISFEDFNKFFITPFDWRDKQINKILDD